MTIRLIFFKEVIMEKSEKKMIINNYEEKCDCREDDNCGCSFPNNIHLEPEAEAVGETAGSRKVLPQE